MAGKIVPPDSAADFDLITQFHRVESVWCKTPRNGAADQPWIRVRCHEWTVGIGREKRHRRHARAVVKFRSGAFASTFDSRNDGVRNLPGREYRRPLRLVPRHSFNATAAPDVQVHGDL